MYLGEYKVLGITITIEDAVVVRSDAAPGQGGVIVFEGTDENGDPAQIVWTPDFDLEGWYWDNYNPSAEPGFYTSDTNSSYTHTYVCFAAETPILTARGPRPVSRIVPGDRVWTLDGGYQPVLWVGQRTVIGFGPNAPVMFSPDTIGNQTPLRLSQQHRVHVASPLAELFFASHEVLAPAKAFAGQDGITFAPCGEVTYVHLLLEQHHILQASGALCESLLLGDEADDILADAIPGQLHRLCRGQRAARPVLTYREACSVIGSRIPRRSAVVL